MRKSRVILLLLLLFGIIGINLFHPEQKANTKFKNLAEFVHNINSININENDFSDLSFLDSLLGNKRIVFLGEQLHTDGSTFEAKSRLIRYLHEKHNFSVVLYEASIFDMWLMNQRTELQTVDSSRFNPSIGLYRFWWDNDYCKPLWKYYNHTLQTKNSITLGGFDIQLTGTFDTSDTRAKYIREYLSEKEINVKEFPAFNRALNQLSYPYKWEYKQFSQTEFDSIQTELKKILDQLDEPRTEKENIYYRCLNGIYTYGQLMWDYRPGEIQRMNIRDSIMAKNLLWQIDSLYNDQKIIVWSANVHLYKSPLSIGKSIFNPLGQYVKKKYPNDSYMLSFTSYALSAPNSQDTYSEAGRNSLEYWMHSKNYKYAYLDMKGIDPDSLLEKAFPSVMNQRADESRVWNNLIDGLFYIDVINSIN